MSLDTKQRLQAYRVLLGNALAEERKKKHLSQQAVANMASISRVSVSYYENGIRSINTDDFLTLCDACGFDAIAILSAVQNASESELQKAYTQYFDTVLKEE